MALCKSQRRLAEPLNKLDQHHLTIVTTALSPLAVGPALGVVSGLVLKSTSKLTSRSTLGLISILRYDLLQAIYQRYTSVRSAWFAAQPRGSIKTN